MIQIDKKTAMLLRETKTHSRQTYDDVINDLLQAQQTETLTQKELKEIEQSLKQIKEGKIHSIESIAKELGVKLWHTKYFFQQMLENNY